MASLRLCQCQRASPPGLIARLTVVCDLDVFSIAARPRGLSDDEEADLLRAIRQGDDGERFDALQALLGDYLQTIITVARLCRERYCSSYNKPGASLEDLVAVGRNTFIRAIETHDPASCSRFSVCAVEAIKTAMLYSLLPERRGHERAERG